MRRISFVLISSIVLVSAFFIACTKIDTTNLGADLIPDVDNIHTFEMVLDVKSDNVLINDSTAVLATDQLPVGYTNDLEFGQTRADLYFDISSPAYKTYPFGSKDSMVTDSVILSLSFKAAYGDTNSIQTLRVFEISQTSGFTDDSLYRINHPDFATTGAPLGTATFTVNKLNDSVQFIRGRDTSKLINVLRIPLDTSFGRRLMEYGVDSTATGAYFSDSLFKTLFRGFAIKSDATGNALTYFSVTDADTKLVVYFRRGTKDTTAVEFRHPSSNLLGVANVVKRTPGGGWATYLNNGDPEDDLLYVQTTPGSYGLLKIPALDTIQNKVIHLAELIVPVVSSSQENIFTAPTQLFLDMINKTGDTAFTIQNDLLVSNFGWNFDQFGGFQRKFAGSLEYRFNISRHVQGAATRKEPNFDLRLYAPFETNVYYLPPGNLHDRRITTRQNIPIVPRIAQGRVVVGGGNNANPSQKLRLRIVYSKI